jgi:hypothetical protein
MNGSEYTHPDVWLACAERRELLRIAAQSALERSQGGKTLIPDARAWALHWAGMAPLRVPMGPGTETEGEQR